MATFVAKNSGGVKKKPMTILKKFIFIRFSLNKRRFQFQITIGVRRRCYKLIGKKTMKQNNVAYTSEETLLLTVLFP